MRRKFTEIIFIFLFILVVFPAAAGAQVVDWTAHVQSDHMSSGTAVSAKGREHVYLAGNFSGATFFNPQGTAPEINGSSPDNSYISKYTSAGVCIWAKAITTGKSVTTYAIKEDYEGNLVVTGHFSHSAVLDPLHPDGTLIASGIENSFVAKFDSGGTFIWARQIYTDTAIKNMTLAIDRSNNIYVCGVVGVLNPSGFGRTQISFAGACALPPLDMGYLDSYVMKLDAAGNCQWATALAGPSNTGSILVCNGMDVDEDGNVYAGGTFINMIRFPASSGLPPMIPNGVSPDAFWMKLDSNGNHIWAKFVGGAQSDRILSLEVSKSGYVYATGYYLGMVDFDPYNSASNSVLGNHAIMGQNSFVLKVDTAGEFVWVRGMVALGGNIETVRIGLNSIEDVFLVGTFSGRVDADPDPAAQRVCTSAGGEDVLVIKLDSSGNYVWSHAAGADKMEGTLGLAVDPGSNVYAAGFFGGEVDFDRQGAGITHTTVADRNGFLTRIVCEDTSSAMLQLVHCGVLEMNGVRYEESGVYTQYLVNHKGCDSVVRLELSLIFTPPVEINVGYDMLSASYSGRRYIWFKDGNLIPDATDSLLRVKENGDYQLAIETYEGCIDTSVVYRVRNLSVDGCCAKDPELVVYPNPTRDLLHLKAGGTTGTVRISGPDGRLLIEEVIDDGNAVLSTGKLSIGVYMLQFNDKHGRILHAEKIIKY